MKKPSLIICILFLSLLLVGCGGNKNTSLPVQEVESTLSGEVVKTRDDFTMDEKFAVHMCLMGDTDPKCIGILDPENINVYGDAIKEQCEIMVGMEACDVYFGTIPGK